MGHSNTLHHTQAVMLKGRTYSVRMHRFKKTKLESVPTKTTVSTLHTVQQLAGSITPGPKARSGILPATAMSWGAIINCCLGGRVPATIENEYRGYLRISPTALPLWVIALLYTTHKQVY